jgi:hypothetical protein
MIRLLAVAAVVLLLSATPGLAEFCSYAVVQDDASLVIQNKVVRLFGIYIPRPNRAATALNFKIQGFVTCEEMGTYDDGSISAICWTRRSGVDLGAYLIREGLALAGPDAPSSTTRRPTASASGASRPTSFAFGNPRRERPLRCGGAAAWRFRAEAHLSIFDRKKSWPPSTRSRPVSDFTSVTPCACTSEISSVSPDRVGNSLVTSRMPDVSQNSFGSTVASGGKTAVGTISAMRTAFPVQYGRAG